MQEFLRIDQIISLLHLCCCCSIESVQDDTSATSVRFFQRSFVIFQHFPAWKEKQGPVSTPVRLDLCLPGPLSSKEFPHRGLRVQALSMHPHFAPHYNTTMQVQGMFAPASHSWYSMWMCFYCLLKRPTNIFQSAQSDLKDQYCREYQASFGHHPSFFPFCRSEQAIHRHQC